MKVIFNGKENEDTTREFCCQQCESILEASIAEFGQVHSDPRDGAYYNITCPVCKSVLFISAEGVRNNTLYVPKSGRSR